VARLGVGEKAPSFTLRDEQSGKVSLKDFLGMRVVLYFYPADDTPGCTKEACQFNDGFAAFRTLSACSCSASHPTAPSRTSPLGRSTASASRLLSDPEKTVMTRYGAFGEKMLYGKKVNGVIRSTFVVGPAGTIEHVWYGVRADGHAARCSLPLAN
jgi:peroxiredoxin Q/BCP